jgi:hypothetical protein
MKNFTWIGNFWVDLIQGRLQTLMSHVY